MRALAHQQPSRAEYRRLRLHRLQLHGHKPHGRALRRLHDRRSVVRVILLPLAERLDVDPWDHRILVAQGPVLAAPVMGTQASMTIRQDG